MCVCAWMTGDLGVCIRPLGDGCDLWAYEMCVMADLDFSLFSQVWILRGLLCFILPFLSQYRKIDRKNRDGDGVLRSYPFVYGM